MGKQSARLYFEGKDHLDVVCMDEKGDPHNHSKIYRGNELLWKREKPKFVFLSDGAICTAEEMDTFSCFPNVPANLSYVKWMEGDTDTYGVFVDVEYAFDKYFAVLIQDKKINLGNDLERTYWLCHSENGYDWKKIKDFGEENRILGIKRYSCGEQEVLAVIKTKDIAFMNERFEFEDVFDIPAEYQENSGRETGSLKTRGKPGTLIIAGRCCVIVINDKKFTVVTGNEYVHISQSVTDADEDGYFYRAHRGAIGGNKEEDGHSFYIERSQNGITWDRWKEITGVDQNFGTGLADNIPGCIICGNALYSFFGKNGTSSYVVAKIEDAGTEMRFYESGAAARIYAVDGTFLTIASDGSLFKCKDIFGEKEQIRITCLFKKPHYYNMSIFFNIACSDKGIMVSIR